MDRATTEPSVNAESVVPPINEAPITQRGGPPNMNTPPIQWFLGLLLVLDHGEGARFREDPEAVKEPRGGFLFPPLELQVEGGRSM